MCEMYHRKWIWISSHKNKFYVTLLAWLVYHDQSTWSSQISHTYIRNNYEKRLVTAYITALSPEDLLNKWNIFDLLTVNIYSNTRVLRTNIFREFCNQKAYIKTLFSAYNRNKNNLLIYAYTHIKQNTSNLPIGSFKTKILYSIV